MGLGTLNMTSKETLKKFRTKLNTKLKKGLPKKIKSQLKTTKLGRTATATAQMASNLATNFSAEAAKQSLDQVLLNLEHRGLSIKESQDLAIKVGRKVLERAESIRAQIAENPLSPAWLKDVRLRCADEAVLKSDETLETDTVAVSTETKSTASEAAKGVAEPRHKERKAHLRNDLDTLPDEESDEVSDDEAGAAVKAPAKIKRSVAARKASSAAPRASK